MNGELRITSRGQALINSLILNQNRTLTLKHVRFSNIRQNANTTDLRGELQNGFIITNYRVLKDNKPAMSIVLYLDKSLYKSEDWVPKSFGIYTDENELFGFGNLELIDNDVGIIVKTYLVLDVTNSLSVLNRINVDSFFKNLENLIKSNLVNKSTSLNLPEDNVLYNHYTINNDFKLESGGIVFKENGNIYKVFLDPVTMTLTYRIYQQ